MKGFPRWVLPVLLLGIYFLIKLQGWGYARQVAQLTRQLEDLRPSLSAWVLSEQLEETRRACGEVAERVRQLDLHSSRLLEQMSQLPSAITLEKLRVDTRLSLPVSGTFAVVKGEPPIRSAQSLRIIGSVQPGVRNPEEILVLWAETLSFPGSRVRILNLIPSLEAPGLWAFEVQMEEP